MCESLSCFLSLSRYRLFSQQLLENFDMEVWLPSSIFAEPSILIQFSEKVSSFNEL